jgi:hypothetical protein
MAMWSSGPPIWKVILSIRRMTFGQKEELKKIISIVLLVLNSWQSRLKREDKTKPMLRAMPTTIKILLFRGEDDTKMTQVEKCN